jgi:integrase
MPAEIQAILEASEGRWRLLILAALLTGMRQGELLGLKWGDVDWKARQVHVRRSYTCGRFQEPKTRTSRRRVDVPQVLIAELRQWRLATRYSDEDDLVFANSAGLPEDHSNLLKRGFYPALRRAGVRRVRLHDLRHCYASFLIASNESPTRIQALMGHSSIMVTFDTYRHLFPNVQDGLAERLASTVLGKTCCKPVADSCRPGRRRSASD